MSDTALTGYYLHKDSTRHHVSLIDWATLVQLASYPVLSAYNRHLRKGQVWVELCHT